MRFADVRHQDDALDLIQRSLRAKRTPHAYLFAGPDGVGKELTAHCLAATLLCPDASSDGSSPAAGTSSASGASLFDDLAVEDGPRDTANLSIEACGTCSDCNRLRAGTHPDLHIIHRLLSREHPDADVRKRKARDIGVDVIREFVIKKAGLKPIHGIAKIFVIREADRITPAAQNALLKTLEEPPDRTYIVLLAASASNLLETTISRCQRIDFNTLPFAFVQERLAAAAPQMSPEQTRWYAHHAGGQLGVAHDAMAHGLYELNIRIIDSMAGMGDATVESVIARWTESAKELGKYYRKADPEISDTEATRRALRTILALTAGFFADLTRCATGGPDIVNEHQRDLIRRLADRLAVARAADAVERLARAERHLSLNANTQLVLEALLNDLALLLAGERVPIV